MPPATDDLSDLPAWGELCNEVAAGGGSRTGEAGAYFVQTERLVRLGHQMSHVFITPDGHGWSIWVNSLHRNSRALVRNKVKDAASLLRGQTVVGPSAVRGLRMSVDHCYKGRTLLLCSPVINFLELTDQMRATHRSESGQAWLAAAVAAVVQQCVRADTLGPSSGKGDTLWNTNLGDAGRETILAMFDRTCALLQPTAPAPATEVATALDALTERLASAINSPV